MNKTRIEYVDYTWNPLTGCKTGCSYCYARRIAERFAGSKAFPNGFEPTFHPKRLGEPRSVETPSRILVCSMADLFGPWVPEEQISKVFAAVRAARWHTYLFLSKYPSRFPRWPGVPELDGCNYWVGTSVEHQHAAAERILALEKSTALWQFISCEPLLGPVLLPRRTEIRWVIIGAQTGPRAVRPEQRWVEDLVRECDERAIPVFCKDNVRPFCSDEFWRREKP